MHVEPFFAGRPQQWLPVGLEDFDDPPEPSWPNAAGLADDAVEPIELRADSAVLDDAPAAPLAVPQRPRGSGRWNTAMLCSLAFHAAVALLLVGLGAEQVLIAGSEDSGIVLVGSAPDEQKAEGDVADDSDQATRVTIVEMVNARAVAAVETAAIAADETAAPLQPVDSETASPAQSDRVAAPRADTDAAAKVEAEPAEVVPADVAPPAADRSATTAQDTAAETLQPVSPAQKSAALPPSPAPEALTAETISPEDENVVPREAAAVADASSDAVVWPETAMAAETVPAETAPSLEMVKPEAAEPAEDRPQRLAATADTERVEAEEVESRTIEEKAEPTRKAEPKKAVEKKAQPPKKSKAEKKKAAAKRAGKQPAEAGKAGSGGQNQADARRGAADGAANGSTAARGKGTVKTAGNAAVSNYPGKVAARLRRSLRYPAEARRSRLKGQVRVAFTVSASGGVTAVRLAGSSGSAVLDKAALDAVRRAAPFPPIPEDAGRSSWSFTVPLVFAQER